MNLRKLLMTDTILYNEINEEFNDNSEIISDSKIKDYIKTLPKNQNTYVLYNDEDIIGCGTIIISTKMIHDFSKISHLEDIFIRKKYRSYGYGKILLNNLIQKSKEEGCYKVILDCNENLKLFYEKNGLENKNIQMSKYF
jgi:glucosamine-phosphate N-acetyltransferase